MAPLQHATLTFTSSKSCFLYVPVNWIQQHQFTSQDLHIFRITYNENRNAYFSAISDFSLKEFEVQLNGKYALSLSFKDKEKVLIERIDNDIAHVKTISLEPLLSDDWEIMQLNSNAVETNLLNQIRVVWKDQVFPIWIHQTSFFVRVSHISPEVEPTLLFDWTEVHVIPKDRNHSIDQEPSDIFKRRKKALSLQYKHLRKHKKSSNTSDASFSSFSPDELNRGETVSLPNPQQNLSAGPVFSLFRYVLRTVFSNGNVSPHNANEAFSSNFIPLHLDFRLRVVSCSNNVNSLPLALQATTVFISDKTFALHSDIFPIPDCFVAKISKILSPSELKEKQQSLDIKEKTKSKKNEKNANVLEKNTVLDSLYVNVVVLKSLKEEFEVPVSLFLNSNVIAIPVEIKRRLGLEVTSVVQCHSVETRPFQFNSIILQPLESIHFNFGDDLASANFNKWIEEAKLDDSFLVLSDGTLIKLPVGPDRTCDFIAFLIQSEDQDSITSPSSLTSNTSHSSTESEKNCFILPNILNYGYLNASHVAKIQIKVGSYSPQISKNVWCHSTSGNKVETLYQHMPALSLEALGGIKEIASKALTDLELWFHLSPLTFELTGYSQNHGCMLIYGPTGVGKTTLIRALCKKLIDYPYYIYISTIECLPLRGKRIETIARKWDAILAEATHRQPSIIIFEDLDKIASAPLTPEQEALPDAIYFSTIAQTFIALIEKIKDNNASIVVIVTSKSIHSLHSLLTSARGRHVFQSVLEIKPPNASARAEILWCLVLSKVHISADLETNDWHDLAAKTEGYVAQDLDTLVDRATHVAFVRTNFSTQIYGGHEQISLIYEDFESALEKYTPAALRGLQLLQGSDKTWKDIGGLQHVKTTIEQILTWPIKYKELFKDFNLRPQTNILLYGAPGTGKTLVAGVVANECGLNFISIKGPELLSKFIGASEQAVRDLFTRASGAKPCILFFDEFDALAPRRGHDSTGVTDRVVNQLLTQIDGVENLEGVYILAATSRPELIDPALLRPGRFDKCLLCPLPDDDERYEILEALASRLALADDVNFKEIVSKTEHFSGADLQALLYSAQIEALHENQATRSRRCSSVSDDDANELPITDTLYMPNLEEGFVKLAEEESNNIFLELNTLFANLKMKGENQMNKRKRKHSTISLYIEQKHILKVLATTKPSVSIEERIRYEKIFQKFRNSSGSEFSMPDKTDSKRVTLA